jgi:hypothetical protein
LNDWRRPTFNGRLELFRHLVTALFALMYRILLGAEFTWLYAHSRGTKAQG